MDLNRLRDAGRFVTMSEGHGIWVLRGGPAPTGDAVTGVFLHGLGGSSLPYRACAEAVEAAGAPTLCIDLRDHGFSEKPDGDAGIDDYTADVLRVLEAEGVTRANLVGHCLGGIVAMRDADLTRALEGTHARTCVIHARRDMFIGRSEAADMARLSRAVRFEVMPNDGHASLVLRDDSPPPGLVCEFLHG